MATRFYLPSSGSAAVSPAYDAGWENTDDAARLATVTTKIESAMTTITYQDDDYTNTDHLIRQYVSAPIAAQTISAQTIESQIRCMEFSSSNNQVITWGVRVVSGDGGTVRGTILAVTRDGTEMNGGALTNRRFTATSSEVVSQNGDRIVIEVGTGGDPASTNHHDCYIRVGDAEDTDLPEDDTATDDLCPWLEFPNTITFYSATRRIFITHS